MLKQFFSYYRPYRRLFWLDFSAAVVSGLMELGFPVVVSMFVDQLLPSGDWPLIVFASLVLLGIYLLNSGLNYVVTYWGHMLGINIETDMRQEAFDHVQELSFSYFDNQKTGKLVGRLTKDLEEIGEVAHHGPEDAFIAVMTLVGAFVLMFIANPALATITACVLPLVIWLTSRYGAAFTRTWREIFSSIARFNTRIEENVGGIRVVQAFGNQQHEKDLFAAENVKYREHKLTAYRIMAKSTAFSYLSMRITQMVVMIAGSWFVLNGQLSNGEFVGFLLLVNVFFRPIEKVNAVLESYPKGIAGFRRFMDLLNTKPEIADAADALAVDSLRGDIRFEDVSFGYQPGRPVLQGIDLDIKSGETVAFVGPSGAGKSTLVALLPRFYSTDSGRITIDGHDIRDLTLNSLRQQIGVVQQDVFLFGGTVRENIAYGKLDATDSAIREAATRARLDEMIANLPDGLDTVIGERGVKLSGGQKQRLSIARMFLKNPPILILDEATSALDTETERAIQESLTELSRGRTTLVIAHRLATIRNADRIVVVDDSGIAEQGRHEDLLAQPGIYSSLHRAQFN